MLVSYAMVITYTRDTCEKISIDYAVMEKSKDIFTLLAEFGWSDLGSWSCLRTLLPHALYDGGVAVHKPSYIEYIGSGRLLNCKDAAVDYNRLIQY